MKIQIFVSSVFATLLVSAFAQGQVTLPQFNQSYVAPFFRTAAADFAFRPVAPASSLGHIWGLSIGASAQQASTSSISNIVGSGLPELYAANISVALQIPFGLAVEAGFLPQVTASGTSLNSVGADIKWTLTESFWHAPFSASIRGLYTNANASDSQTIGGGPVSISYGTDIYGGLFTLSKDFLFIEPYISGGVIQHTSTLSATGSGTFFDSSFQSGTTSTSLTAASGWLQAGVELKLTILTISAEYDNLFGINSYAARMALKF